LRIAVSAVEAGLDAAVDPRFGRCAYYLVVDTDTLQFEAVPNISQGAPSGAGIQAAQTIVSKGARAVLTGNVGPNAYQALSSAGIRIITGVSGTVREAIMKYKKGELEGVSSSAAAMGYRTGGGFGMGMGPGGGRGRGMGRGMGMGRFAVPTYPGAPPAVPLPQMTKEQEVQMLRDRMGTLQAQLDQIKKRLEELEE